MNTILNEGIKMIKIKDFKLDGNWAEVTWVEESIQTSEEGVETTTETQVHCESYSGHPEHIVMLTSKADELRTSLDEYTGLIAELASTYVAPTQAELDEAARVHKLNEATSYLAQTDWVNAYKLRHDLGLELISKDSSKWLVINKRVEYIEFLKGS